ncbi:MAG: NFACT RNA binding domain-containing protein [Chloroflexota bacterium]
MYFDPFTISALVDEFMDTIVGGRVQDSVVVDSTGIGLEIYGNRKRHYLYLSADANAPRVHLVETKLRRGMPRPTQLALLVRKNLEGGGVVHVSQPPYERILHIDFETRDNGKYTIIVEPIERRSNVILVQDGMILDAARRVGTDDNRVRTTLPAHEYEAPPPMTGRLDPAKLTREAVYGMFDQNDDENVTTTRLIGRRLMGVSPLMCREMVHLSGAPLKQKAADADRDALFEAMQAYYKPLLSREWKPGIIEKDGEVAGFSVYPVTHVEGWREMETVSAALTAYYGAPSGPDGYKIAKKPVRDAVRDALGRERGKLHSMKSSLKDQDELEKLRQSGELILAYQYALTEGQTELRAQYDPEGDELVIKLQPEMTPLENAQRYFKKYDKAKSALENVPKLVAETEGRLNYLTQLETDIDLAGSWPEIDEVRQILQSLGYWKGKPAQKIANSGNSGPLRLVSKDGFVMWVGRNSRQNDAATFGKGGGDDLWLHARDVPGAHVVIKFDGRKIPEDVIEQAASIAAFYSKLRIEGNVIVDVTQCKYVKKIKGAAPGMVTYRNEETRTVVPRSEDEFEMA